MLNRVPRNKDLFGNSMGYIRTNMMQKKIQKKPVAEI